MIKNTKGNKSYTRPLPIRMLAILMAVVMVLSVLYINNSKGRVEAATYQDPAFLSTKVKVENVINGDNYTIDVPFDGDSTEAELVSFVLPSLTDTGVPTGNTNPVDVIRYTDGGTDKYCELEDKPETVTEFEKYKLKKTVTYTGYRWSTSDSSAPEDALTTISVQKAHTDPTYVYLLLSGSVSYTIPDDGVPEGYEPIESLDGISIVGNGPFCEKKGSIKLVPHLISNFTVSNNIKNQTIDVAHNNGTYTGADLETSSEYYYGGISYEFVTGEGLKSPDTTSCDIDGLNDYLNSDDFQEGDKCKVKKVISDPNITYKIVFPEVTITKNLKLITGYKAYSENQTIPDEYSAVSAINRTGVNPLQNYKIVFKTDTAVDNDKISSDCPRPGYSIETNSDGLTHTLTVPKYVDLNEVPVDSVSFKITVKDGEPADNSYIEQSLEISLTYKNDKATISGEQINGNDLVEDTITYVKDSNVTFSAIVTPYSTETEDKPVVVFYNTSTPSDKTKLTIADDNKVSQAVSVASGLSTYKITATSPFGISTDSKDYKVFYDDNEPSIADFKVKQGTELTKKTDSTDPEKVYDYVEATSQKNLDISFNVSDLQKKIDESTPAADGSGIALVKINDKNVYEYDPSVEESIPINKSITYTYETNKNDFIKGGEETLIVKVLDKSGRESKYSIVVKYQNETAKISADFNFGVVDETNNYFNWEDASVKKAVVTFTIETDAEIESSGLKLTVDENDLTSELTEFEEVTAPSGSAYSKAYKVNYKYPTVSKKDYSVQLAITNCNGYSGNISETFVKSVDLINPSETVDDSAYIDDKWYNNVVLKVTVSDGDPSSSIKYVKAEGTDAESYTVGETGVISAKVKQSEDSNGTNVKLTVYDKAGNKSTDYIKTIKVDDTKPTVELTINSTEPKSFYTSDPTIYYSWIDELSGIDISKTKITIDGKETKATSFSAKEENTISLKSYLGVESLDPTHDYVITIEAVDVAGNAIEPIIKSFRVDGQSPEVKGKIDTVAKKNKDYPTFFKEDVKLTVTVADANVLQSNLEVTDAKGHSLDVSWEKTSETLWTGTIKATSEGEYSISVKAIDESKLSGSWSTSFTIDKTAPSLDPKLNGESYKEPNSFVTSASVTADIVEGQNTYDSADVTTKITRVAPDGTSTVDEKTGVGPFSLTADGVYKVEYNVADKADNRSIATSTFTVDNSKPVHNMYITTADPAKVAKYNNTYSNAVGKFSGHSDQESYTYGQYYNTDVTIEFSFFDYNIKEARVTDNGSALPINWTINGPVGKGSYTISGEGSHDIQISSTDQSGNTTTDSAANQRLRFTIDKSAPTISTSLNGVRYSEGSGVRYFNTNGTIDVSVSDANIDGSDLNRINRMTVPGSSVSVSEASVGEGAETFSTEADYEVQYYAIDRAGNRSDTRTVMFRVDKTAPQLQVSNVGAVSTAGSQNVSFNVKEAFFSDMNNVTIKIYKRVEGRAEVLEKTIDFKPNSANDSTSYTFSEDAEYRIEFTAEDKCGNKSNTDYSFIKDGTAPLITLSGVSNYDKTDKNVELTVIIDEAFYSSNRVTLSGTRTDISGKSNAITFDSFVTNRSKISQLQQLFKEDGIYDITVTSTDKAGNSSSKGVHFTIDTTDPVIGDLSKYDGIRTNSFKWDTNLDDLVTDLTVCDIKVYMDGSLYDGTSDVEDGSHVLKIEATDELGHTTTKEVTFVIDSRGPNIIISNVEDGDNLLDSTEVIVTVELDEDSLDTVMLNDKAIEIKDNQAKLTVNKKGKYTLSATAHDEAGNASSAEIKFTFGKQTNLLLIGIIAGILILLLLALLVVIKRRQKDQ